MIVADTNLLIHLFTQTELTQKAQEVLVKDSHWVVPPLWREEYANVLCKLVRNKTLSKEQAISHFNFVREQLKPNEVSVESAQALKIALEYGVSVYDAHFIALALSHNTVVVTEDQEMIKYCPAFAVDMQSFLN